MSIINYCQSYLHLLYFFFCNMLFNYYTPCIDYILPSNKKNLKQVLSLREDTNCHLDQKFKNKRPRFLSSMENCGQP